MDEAIVETLRNMFGGDVAVQPLTAYQAVSRSVLLFLVGAALVRIGKSRLIARATPIDALMGFTMGSILSRGMTGAAALSTTCAACAALVFIHWALTAAACRSHHIGNLIKGRAQNLVVDGQMDLQRMRNANISVHDLLEQLRLNGNVDQVEQVRRACMERSGEISVIRVESIA